MFFATTADSEDTTTLKLTEEEHDNLFKYAQTLWATTPTLCHKTEFVKIASRLTLEQFLELRNTKGQTLLFHIFGRNGTHENARWFLNDILSVHNRPYAIFEDETDVYPCTAIMLAETDPPTNVWMNIFLPHVDEPCEQLDTKRYDQRLDLDLILPKWPDHFVNPRSKDGKTFFNLVFTPNSNFFEMVWGRAISSARNRHDVSPGIVAMFVHPLQTNEFFGLRWSDVKSLLLSVVVDDNHDSMLVKPCRRRMAQSEEE